MDTITRLRNAVKQVIERHTQYPPPSDDIRVEKIFDETQDHYALVYAGWQNRHRVEGQVIHLDIINEKIWIQHDGTDRGVAYELEELGISKQEIVLAFKAPHRRALTGYAVA